MKKAIIITDTEFANLVIHHVNPEASPLALVRGFGWKAGSYKELGVCKKTDRQISIIDSERDVIEYLIQKGIAEEGEYIILHES